MRPGNSNKSSLRDHLTTISIPQKRKKKQFKEKCHPEDQTTPIYV